MEFILNYTDAAVRDLYNKLVQQKDLGTSKDYEIFIDHISVIPRTNDLNNFFKYKYQLRQNSQTLVVRLYKGHSRVNDCYVFETPYLLAQKQREKRQQIIDKEFEKHAEINRLLTTIKRIKKKKNKLKSRNQVLEAELKQFQGNKNSIELVGKIGSLFQSPVAEAAKISPEGRAESSEMNADTYSQSNTQSTSIGGIETDVLLKIYSDFKGTLTDAEFQACLGVFMSLGHYKDLIGPTQEFIKSKIEPMEKSKE
ncbi:MAG: hypothetical protein K0R65_847 [Crocinitomicaceae bacterium]|jgi:hypothetical protein|nr:hypothetical protein [Crocinitomicaceae bacterium]